MHYTDFVFDEVRWEEWSKDHVARHGVSPDEVEEVLSTRPRYTTKGRNDTYLVYGRTSNGRYLLVVAADDGARAAFVVTARDMSTKERRTYCRRAR